LLPGNKACEFTQTAKLPELFFWFEIGLENVVVCGEVEQ